MLLAKRPAGVALRDAVSAAVAWAVIAAANTLLFLGMRAVMAVGGACADGGPYVSAQPCPDGVGVAMTLAFPLGAGAWIAAQYFGLRVGGLWAGSLILAWTALFGSLGWNFWEAALAPMTAGQGPDWGGVICGLAFWGMALGGVGALSLGGAALFPIGTRAGRGAPVEVPPGSGRHISRAGAVSAEVPAIASPAGAHPAFGEETQALLDRLERLADMRDRGLLDVAEYETAKDAVVRELEARR